jgi:hypothetical protein
MVRSPQVLPVNQLRLWASSVSLGYADGIDQGQFGFSVVLTLRYRAVCSPSSEPNERSQGTMEQVVQGSLPSNGFGLAEGPPASRAVADETSHPTLSQVPIRPNCHLTSCSFLDWAGLEPRPEPRTHAFNNPYDN